MSHEQTELTIRAHRTGVGCDFKSALYPNFRTKKIDTGDVCKLLEAFTGLLFTVMQSGTAEDGHEYVDVQSGTGLNYTVFWKD